MKPNFRVQNTLLFPLMSLGTRPIFPICGVDQKQRSLLKGSQTHDERTAFA